MMKTFAASSYLILGDGRVARQFQNYFTLSSIPFVHWSRKKEAAGECPRLTEIASAKNLICLMAVSDKAIAGLARTLRDLGFGKLVHFSGTVTAPGAAAFHPLMTFSHRLLSTQEFEAFSFVGTSGEKDFRKIFRKLPNPYCQITEARRSLYHANCVASGNFANVLWKKTFVDFQSLGIPSLALRVYLQAVLDNFFEDPQNSLTGPIVRNDTATIEENLLALKDDFRAEIYLAIVKAFAPTAPTKGDSHEHA